MANRFKTISGFRHGAVAALILLLALGSSCTSNDSGGGAATGSGSRGGSGGSGGSGASASGAGGMGSVAGSAATSGSAAAGAGGAQADASNAKNDGGPGVKGTDVDAGTDGGAGMSAIDADAGSDGGAALPGWSLTFSDEFNGKSGTAVDTSKWNLVNKGDGFGNNELQVYTNRTNNAALDGQGSLVIKAIKESYMGREYTSARLESNGKFEQMYGRIEARIKVPRGQGIWPAFWMLGNDIGSAGWPTCGEIDIMENIGKEPTIVHGTLHGPGYSGGNPLGASYTLPNGGKFADDFHEFAVEWEQNVVRFYVDDNLYKTRTPADVPNGSRWVYDHPFYMILNVAVGGQWPGSPDQSTVFPQTMSIDYVRVYER